ncbi:APC family permease [Heliobacterium chlorum]|uniref:APC family permease n=1 Tax=Heliobacterium chlorum TaxID=2698 RepID=A0ABR7T6F2_HELCL|nr:APC family permease [Heliobacterium chlorum]MBC9786347.1 APC family permease [Heliobacterium chlorum]
MQIELKRTLTMKNLVIFGMITMSPLAPFQVFGAAAQASYGMVSLVYLIGAVLMLFTASSYARFSKEFPYAGSVYSYVVKGFNPHVGFIAGWTILSDYILAPALMCLFSGIWLTGIFPNLDPKVLAIVFIIITAIINIRGVELNAKVNTFLFVIQIIALVLFIAFAIKYVFIEGLGVGGFSLLPIYQPEHIDWNFVATATSLILLGFVGFDGISTLAEEVNEPEKVVGRATVVALVTTAIMFLIQTYFACLAHNNYADLNPDMAMFDIAKEIGGQYFYIAMLLINVIAVGLAVTLNVQSSVSRILFAMGRDNIIPASNILKKLHPEYKTPINAILLSVVISLALILTLDLTTILMFVNFGAVTAFMILNLSVIVYFFFKKNERGFKGILEHLLFPFMGLSVCAFVWSGFDRKTMIVGFSWIVIGAIVGFVKSKGYKNNGPNIDNM